MRIRKQARQLPAWRDSSSCLRDQAGDHGSGAVATTLGAAAAMAPHIAEKSCVEPVTASGTLVDMSQLQSGGAGHGGTVRDDVRELDLSQELAAPMSQPGLVGNVENIASTNGQNLPQQIIKLPAPAAANHHLESSYAQDVYDDYDDDYDDDDENLTRHYVRRGLRSICGDGVTPEKKFVVAGIPKITKSYDSHCDRAFPAYSEKKLVPGSLVVPPRATVRSCRHVVPRSAVPCNSNEDDDHPSREPEGSLLHSLYLQLLAAGREGISLRSLYASFESQTSLPRLASNWREEVKAHLKSGPYFDEVKGRYLLCEFLVQPSRRNAKRKGSNSESLGVQTRRKAYQKTYEAVLCESAMEFQKLQHHQKINGGGSDTPVLLRSESTESDDLDIMRHATPTRSMSAPLNRMSKTRKPMISDHDDGLQMARNVRFGGAIPGSLKAMQARIIAETGVQGGVRCARKDGSNDSSKWQCPMMAMEGHTLCEHHSFLNERKRARYAKARRHGDNSTLAGKSPPSRLREKPSTKVHESVHSPSEHDKSDSDDLAGLDEVASQALLTMKSDILAVASLHHQVKPLCFSDHTNPVNEVEQYRPKPVNEEIPRSTKCANSAPQFFARSATGRFIAAKKTAVKIPSLSSLDTEISLEKSSAPPTRPPSIPPLPAFYGPRRKTVKNRSLLSIS